jgi:pimeloyl-ACP methyl ester carboxylesterase
MTVTSNFVETNGVRLHYLRAGDGPRAIVLTHGNSLCGGAWEPLLEALGDDEYTVIAADLRGHGWSEKPERGYDWESLRDDLVGLVSALNLRDLLFVGHSRGGGVALLAAAALADRTRGVLAFEPTVPPRLDEQGRFAPLADAGRMTTMMERAERRRETFPDRAALASHYRGRPAFHAWRQDYFDAFMRYGTQEQPDGIAGPAMPGRVAAQLFAAMANVDAWNAAPRAQLPVHVIFGAESGRLAPGRDPLDVLRALYPACTMSVMEQATHTGPMERPELFERLIRAYSHFWVLPDAVQR